MDKKRWALYVTPEFNEKLQILRAEFGLTEGALALLLMKMGYEAFIRAYKPQDIMSVEGWKKLMEAASEKNQSGSTD